MYAIRDLAKRLSDGDGRAQHQVANISPRFLAMIGCLTGHEFTQPAMAALIVTSDGHLMAQQKGDIGYNDFIGHADQLKQNLRGLTGCLIPDGEDTSRDFAEIDMVMARLKLGLRG